MIQAHCLEFWTEFDTVLVFLSVNTSSVPYVYKCLGEIGPEKYLLEPGAALAASQRGPGHRPLGQGNQEPSTQMLGLLENV